MLDLMELLSEGRLSREILDILTLVHFHLVAIIELRYLAEFVISTVLLYHAIQSCIAVFTEYSECYH